MNTRTKLGLARKGIGGLAGTSYRTGKLVGATTTSARGARRGAKAAGLELKDLAGSARYAAEKAPKIRRELARPPSRKAPLVAGIAVGAAGAYFLDPQNGRRRREKVVEAVQGTASEPRRAAAPDGAAPYATTTPA